MDIAASNKASIFPIRFVFQDDISACLSSIVHFQVQCSGMGAMLSGEQFANSTIIANNIIQFDPV